MQKTEQRLVGMDTVSEKKRKAIQLFLNELDTTIIERDGEKLPFLVERIIVDRTWYQLDATVDLIEPLHLVFRFSLCWPFSFWLKRNRKSIISTVVNFVF